MASTSALDFDLSAPEPSRLPIYRRLALLNGILIGLAVGLGAWGIEAARAAALPARLYLLLPVLGVVVAVVLCGLVGWLSGRLARTPITVGLWLLAAAGLVLLMGHLPFAGRTLIAWLADSRFWGREVYPNTLGGSNSGLILGGLLLLIAFGVLGLLQEYRLEGLVASVGSRGRLRGRDWAALLWPALLVFAAAAVTRSMMVDPSALALRLTDRAMAVGRDYAGDDYRDMGTIDGINYAALRGLEGQLSGDYALGVAEINTQNATVVTTVDFDNGAWIYCRVINDQLSYCYDASPAYINTLRSLIEGRPLPDPCRGCDVAAAATWGPWFDARRGRVGENPMIERVARQGNQTLFRISSAAATSPSIDCWFDGAGPVRLTDCREADVR